jgi:TonB family protein
MKRLSLAFFSMGTLSVVVFAAAQHALAQSPASSDTPQTAVVLTKLSPPVYPPLARQARITGDVKVQVMIRKDGSVESVEITSGHPLLKQAALESAQRSTFECRDCSAQGTSSSLIYTFGFRDDGGCADVIEERPARSAKCLYLWKCGVQAFSTWHRPENLPPEVTQAPGHVTILVSSECVETISAH